MRSARALSALALYGGLVVWLTWPLGSSLGTHLPRTAPACGYDSLYSAWALAWESHALVSASARIADANIFQPARNALFYGPTAFGALPYFAPTFLATGNPALALNLLFLGGIALTAFGLHAVIVAWTGSQLAGLVAGSTFLGSRWVLWEFVPTTPHFAVLLYLPWIAYLGGAPRLDRGAALGLLALVVLQALVDPVYLAPAALAPLACLALARLARRSTRADAWRLALVLAAAGLALLPFMAGHLAVRSQNPDLAHQTIWAVTQEPIDLPWGLLAPLSPAAVPVAALWLIALGAASFALGRRWSDATLRRVWASALLWVAFGLLMSLTPTLGFLRVPSRLAIDALIGLALLAGLAFAECAARLADGPPRVLARLGPTALAAALLGLGYAQYLRGFETPFSREALPLAYPLQAPVSPGSSLVKALRRPGGALLELPVELEQVYAPPLHARAMYRSIFHGRPLLNGYSSYWPEAFPARIRLASRLPDASALAELRRTTGLEAIVVDTSLLAPEQRATWLAIARGGAGSEPFELLAVEDKQLLFALRDATEPSGR
jgi:hypothetical protein